MGLKLNKFSTFAALCNNDDPVVNRFFDSFKLTAILLCDQSDQCFINEINRNFRRLSETTGEGLLFISFTESGNSIPFIGRFAGRSLGMTEEEIRRLQEALTEDTTMDQMNLSDLARQFHVDVEQLPVIVLTNTIKSDQALIIPTNSKDVGYQLSQLAYLANDQIFHGSLDKIDAGRFGPYTEFVRFKKGVANMLTDVMSRAQLQSNPSDREAVQWNSAALHENVRRLDELVKGDQTEQEWENELMEYVYNRIIRFSAPDPNVLHPFQISEEKMVGSEDNTLKMLNTYNLFSTLLDADGMIQSHDPVYRKRRYDYSRLSVLLGKMFENELTYSIVQQMRQCIKIPMPQYYCKYCQGKNGVVERNNLKADLNQCKYGKYKPVSIGDAKVAYDILKNKPNEPDGPSLTVLNPKSEKLWEKLKEGRNDAAHTSFVSCEDFIGTHKLFSRFLDDNGFFSQLVQIKRQLRGDAR